MLSTSEKNFMQIGCNLGFLEKKILKCYFGRFSAPCDSKSKILAKISPRGLKFWLIPFFCMRNPKKMVP